MFTKKKPPEASENEAPSPGEKCPTCGQVMPAGPPRGGKTGGKPPGTYVKPAWKTVADKMTGKG